MDRGEKASLYLSLHPLTVAVGDTPAKLLLRRLEAWLPRARARERETIFRGLRKILITPVLQSKGRRASRVRDGMYEGEVVSGGWGTGVAVDRGQRRGGGKCFCQFNSFAPTYLLIPPLSPDPLYSHKLTLHAYTLPPTLQHRHSTCQKLRQT